MKMEHTSAIEEHKQDLAGFQKEHNKLKEDLDKNQKYLQYLEMTCECTGDEFGEPLDLQHRYETLQETNQTLAMREKTRDEDHNQQLKEFRKYQQERSTETQVLDTKIAQMRLEQEDLKQE